MTSSDRASGRNGPVVSRRRSLRVLAAGLLVLGGTAVPFRTGRAQSLDQARAAGLVGERPDGYVGAVDPSAAGLAQQINAQRRDAYQQAAAASGEPLSVVEARSGQRLVDRARSSGWYHWNGSQWVR